MSAHALSNDNDLSSSIKELLSSPLRFQTYKQLFYLILMFPLGIIYFNLLIVGFFTGISLIMIGIGIPLLFILFGIIVELAGFERRLVGILLETAIPAREPDIDGSRWERSKRLVTASQTWRAVGYLLSEFVYGTITFGLLASGIATAVSFLFAPTYYQDGPISAYWPLPTSNFTLDILFGWDSLLIGLTTTFRLVSWHIETLFGALLVSAFGLVLLWGTLLFGNAAAELWAAYARRMLTTPRYWPTSWQRNHR